MAAGRLLIPGWNRALDSDGEPISARISLFNTGTDDLASVYANEALTVPLANPVESNSAGRFPAIWADDAVTYDWSVEAPYGPPGSPFTGTGLTTALSADILTAEAAEAAANNAEASAAEVAADYAAILALAESAPATDPVAIAGKVSYTALAATNGSTLVGFLQAGTGAVARTAQDKLRDFVSVKDFGVVGTGVDADSAKIQAAINSIKPGGLNAGKSLLFPGGGTYVCSNIDCSDLANVELIGYGATIKGPSTGRVKSYFEMEDSDGGVVFKGFTFDQMQSSLPVYTQADYANDVYNCPIYAFQNSGSVRVEGCKFTNQYTSAILWRLSGPLLVENCRFEVPVCNQTFGGVPAAQWWQCIHVQSVSTTIRILGCDFVGAATTNPALAVCAVYASGTSGKFEIKGCTADYCGRDNTGTHRLGVFDFYGDVGDVTVEDNVATNCLSQFMRLSACYVGKVSGNAVTMSTSAELDYSCITLESTVFGTRTGCRDIEVSGNTFSDPSSRCAFTIGSISYDWGAIPTRIRICNNNFISSRLAVVTEGPFFDVSIEGNKMTGGAGSIRVNPGTLVTTGTVAGTQANSSFDRMFIRRNSIDNPTAGNGGSGIILALGTAVTARVGLFEVIDNTVKAVTNTGQGIILQCFSTNTANTRTVCRGNDVRGYNYNYYPRDNGEIILEDNRSQTAGTAGFLDGGGYTALHRRGNRFGSGVLRGTATLVAGTVTVANTEILTGDAVILWRVTRGGTVGQIALGTITSGTSFVVNSDNAADTSVIGYEIIH